MRSERVLLKGRKLANLEFAIGFFIGIYFSFWTGVFKFRDWQNTQKGDNYLHVLLFPDRPPQLGKWLARPNDAEPAPPPSFHQIVVLIHTCIPVNQSGCNHFTLHILRVCL